MDALKVNRAGFFPRARASVFRGYMTQSEVNGVNALLDAFEEAEVSDARFVAYMLATAFHETARTMEPIAEYGKGRGHAYGVAVNGRVYYGRGYVQLTWLTNYEAMSAVTGVDLVGNPDFALVPDIAAKIMIHGMTEGTFTGKRLAGYFNAHTTDFLNAREIVNGRDCEAQIAAYARNFLASIGEMK